MPGLKVYKYSFKKEIANTFITKHLNYPKKNPFFKSAVPKNLHYFQYAHILLSKDGQPDTVPPLQYTLSAGFSYAEQ
jgi:hypothetical protein